jgi:replication factor C subunit 2/4
MEKFDKNISWLEKYKPNNIGEIYGQNDLMNMLEKSLETKELPHLLFHGLSGTGKTTTIKNFLKQFYENEDVSNMILELDSVNERGIQIVRDKIKYFSKKAVPQYFKEKNIKFKFVILDEAETITSDAQTALRRCIESYSYITRFCIICNDINKIIDPIKSRCFAFYFKPVDTISIINKLTDICKAEDIKYSKKSLELLANISQGDMRKAINDLNYIYLFYNKINTTNISEYFPVVQETLIKEYIDILKKKNDNQAYKITQAIIKNGCCIVDFLTKFIEYIVVNSTFNDLITANITIEAYKIQTRLIKGSDEYLQLMYLSTHITEQLKTNTNIIKTTTGKT